MDYLKIGMKSSMGKKKEKTVMGKLLNKEPVDQINLFLQSILLVLLLLFVIMSIFVQEFSGTVKILMSMLLFVMAYNNITIFKRKGFGILYILVAIYFMIAAVLEAYGS